MTSKTSTASAVHNALRDLGDNVVSLYLPLPAIEVGGEKWRILQKNALAKLEEHCPDHTGLAEELEGIDLPDFRGSGIGLFSDGGKVRVLHLTHRPRPLLKVGGPAAMLPALADSVSDVSRWVAVIDRDHARLVLVDNGRVIDHTARLTHDSFEKIAGMRETMNDVLFHSAARGGARTPAEGAAKFHALGTDLSGEHEKAEEDFYTGFAKAVEAAVPPSEGAIILAGDPKRTGRCAPHFHRLEVRQLHMAGDALTDESIADEVSALEPAHPGEIGDADPAATAIGPIDVRKAGEAGQADAVCISGHLTGLEDGTTDEHTRINAWEDVADLDVADRAVAAAVETGARLLIAPEGQESPVVAHLRWEQGQKTAGAAR